MRKKKPATIMIIPLSVLAVLLMATLPALCSASEGMGLAKTVECSIYVDPSYVEVESGEEVSVDILYQGYDPLQEIRGITVTVDYDSSVVAISTITEGDFLAGGGPTQFYANILGDRATIDCAIIGGYSGAQGSGVYATVSFQGVMSGTTAVHLSNISVRDPDNQSIPAASGDGTIVVFLPTSAEAVPFWAIKKMLAH
jgi:hypothetical protein